jgi:hypothetical protein
LTFEIVQAVVVAVKAMLMQLRGMEQPSRALGDLGYQFFKSRIVAVLFGRQLGNIGIVLSRKLQQRLELPAVRFDLPIARFDLPIARFNLPVARFRTANQRFQAIVKIHAQIIPLLQSSESGTHMVQFSTFV